MPSYKVSFTTDTWTEDKEVLGDLTLSRVRTERTLSGCVEGKALAMYIMVYFGPPGEDPRCPAAKASFDGEMIIHGSIDGKSGSFALRATGLYTGGVETSWTVVEGSGTGELQAIKGTGAYSIPPNHSCPTDAVLDVEF
ncbi:hypothetical protein CspeluHIS016_0901290 [Cutaneotrichosporon spelunceum]|uniref:DUF3224 domain-containing protein n=1 Tax=Cutaneotrichosporon spelunceum TaxID=1672016 RepID=A0AAD3TZZ1_9TREE|nr:hypothetical protein CspeluHIS016_0901290 [Cutaneotrichosporon spelunceum]